jgi:hypothetical protein
MTSKQVAVMTSEESLAAIADSIKTEYNKGVDTAFDVGRLLVEARSLFPGDTEFGQWFREQEFPFVPRTSQRLMWAAQHEEEVRELIATTSKSQRDIGVVTAVQQLQAGPPKAKDPIVEEAEAVDPAYAAMRAAYFAVIGSEEEPGNAFLSMHAEDLTKVAGFIKVLAKAYNEAKAAVERA